MSLQAILDSAVFLKYTRGVADCYRRFGTIYKNEARLDSAISFYVRSVTIAGMVKDIDGQASSLNQIAVIYKELGNNTQALFYFMQAMEQYSLVKDYRGLAHAGINIAEIYFELGNIQEAEKLCWESRSNSLKWEQDTSGLGYNYDLLSHIYSKKGAFQIAFSHSQRAVWLFRKDLDYTGLLPALIQLADIHNSLNHLDSAQSLYKECYQRALQHTYRKWAMKSAKLLSENFTKNKQCDSAILYLKIYSNLQESLTNNRIEKAVADAITRYDVREKDKQIFYKNQVLEKMSQQHTLLILFILALAFTIVALVWIFSQRRKIQRKESALQNANALLQGQDAERERIARELHDGVGSMLSTVKLHFSDMDGQMGELVKAYGESHKKAILLLDETYEEVRRISHDLDTGLLGRFGLRTAIMQLAQAIESSNKLRIQYIDNDLDSALYKAYETDLYRITQELLSNTIKYAGAKEVSVQLSRNNGNLVYSYEDDGAGFSKEVLLQQKGMGYKNINARVKKMKGTWHLDTSPGNGLNLIIELPIHANTTDHS